MALAVLVCTLAAPASAEPAPPAGADDPLFPDQLALHRMGVPKAWERSTGRGILVAELGIGGVDHQHEDLVGQLVQGWDPGEEPPEPDDHDTSAAGIVVARRNNGRGIAGAAPEALLMQVPHGPRRSTTYSSDAIRWAVDRGARVIFFEYAELFGNETYGFAVDLTGLGSRAVWPLYGPLRGKPGTRPTPIAEAAEYAWDRGALMIGGAGNFYLPFCLPPGDLPRVLCVGALDSAENWEPSLSSRAAYSGYGFGLDVLAAVQGPAPTYDPDDPDDHSSYDWFGGTSAASAYAAGVAALVMSAGATNVEAFDILRCTAEDLDAPGPDFETGYGLIDAYAAVSAVGSGITCPPTPDSPLDLVERGLP